MGSNSIIVIFIFSSLAFLFLSSVAEPVNPDPQATPSYKIREGHGKQFEKECFYQVPVVTDSPKVTTGNLTVKFGDAHANQVYKQTSLDGFVPGFITTFYWYGSCMESRICYLFLRVDNGDGWTPKAIIVYKKYERRRTPLITYNYVGDEHALNGKWYGVNRCGCGNAAAKAAAGTDRIPEIM